MQLAIREIRLATMLLWSRLIYSQANHDHVQIANSYTVTGNFHPKFRANSLICLGLPALLLPQCFQTAGFKHNQKANAAKSST